MTNVGRVLEARGRDFIGDAYKDPINSFLELHKFSNENPEVIYVRLISSNWPNGQLGPWIHTLIGGAQPFHAWWAPVAQRHKKGGGGQGIRHEVHLYCQTPHLHLQP